MSLGNNRDYKTSDRRGRKQLEIHSQLMNTYMTRDGLSREEASSLALRHMENKLAEAMYEMNRLNSGGYALGTTGKG